jgi:hypothetical protein
MNYFHVREGGEEAGKRRGHFPFQKVAKEF